MMLENFNSHGPADLIEKSNLTAERLHEIFRAAYMKPEIDSEDALTIRGRTRIKYVIQIRERQGLIALFCVFGFKGSVEKAEKLEAVNKLNDGKVMARFSVNRRESLFIDYNMLIEEGVTPLQILNCFTRFDNVVISGMDEIQDLLA